jgi:hypothetical protein
MRRVGVAADIGSAILPSATKGGIVMRKTLTAAALAVGLSVIPVTAAFATVPPDDPNDVEAVDNPVDENDESGFDDWGLLGLLGLVGLAGLAGRKRVNEVRTYDDRSAVR